MKRLLSGLVGLVCFLFMAVPVRGQVSAPVPTLAYAEPCPNSSSLSGTSWGSIYQCSLPEPAQAGDTILFSFGTDVTAGNQVFTVTDDKSNTYTLDVTSATVNNKQLRVYRAVNIAANTNFIQVNLTSGQLNGFWQPTVAVFYNAATLDASSCNTGTSATITAGSLTPTAVGDLIYQVSYAGSPTPQTANFTAGSQANITWALAWQLLGDDAAMQWGVDSATTAINPTFTQPTSQAFISCAVALKSSVAGRSPTLWPRAQLLTIDALPKNAANPWTIGAVANGDTVYVAYIGNDQLTNNLITSTPTPTVVNWTASGADFSGLNGHNHVMFFCAKFATPPGPFTISLSRVANTNDSINMVYDVVGGTCNGDGDSTLAGVSSATTSLTVCSACITPTQVNDLFFSEEGQAFETATATSAPAGATFDSCFFQGNNVSGPTQTCENNYWTHFRNTNLSAVTVTLTDANGSSTIGNFAARTAAYKAQGTPAASCSQTDVQNAINAANTGDVIVVLGPCTTGWASVVTIPNTKGITVRGSNGVTINTDGFVLNQGANSSRITGFDFTNQGSCGSATVPIKVSGAQGNAPYRIDNNTFIVASASSILACLNGNGTGLVDHNNFQAAGASEMIHVCESGCNASWTDDANPGSALMTYIETNTFTNTDTTFIAQSEEGFTDSRAVFRYNGLIGAANDVHDGTNGGRWWEFYNNTYRVGAIGSTPANFIQFRGGSGLYYNNHKVGVTSVTQFGPDCPPPSDTCSGTWLVQFQMGSGLNGTNNSPAYAWGNDSGMAPTLGQSTVNFVFGGTAFNDATNCTGHPANQCDYIVTATQPATLLRCESAADVTAGCPKSFTYTPFTYPYPLTAAGMPNPGLTLAPPTGIKVTPKVFPGPSMFLSMLSWLLH